jgi:hypothetical protein
MDVSDKITRTNQTRPCDLKIHRTCRDICKHINAVSHRVMLELYLRHDFYEAIFRIKQIIYSLKVSPLPNKKCWVHTSRQHSKRENLNGN